MKTTRQKVLFTLLSFDALVMLYVGGYFLLMNRSCGAYNEMGIKEYPSAFIGAPSIKIGKRLSIYGAKSTWFNVLYSPMDKLFNTPSSEVR